MAHFRNSAGLIFTLPICNYPLISPYIPITYHESMDNESRHDGKTLCAYVGTRGSKNLDEICRYAGGVSKAEAIRRLLAIAAGDPEIKSRVRWHEGRK